MSADSIIPNPLNGQSFNRYSYVGNNPLAFTDPNGHIDCDHDGNHCKHPDEPQTKAPYFNPFRTGLIFAGAPSVSGGGHNGAGGWSSCCTSGSDDSGVDDSGLSDGSIQSGSSTLNGIFSDNSPSAGVPIVGYPIETVVVRAELYIINLLLGPSGYVPPGQGLTYTTLYGAHGGPWVIKWGLKHPSPNGGWIVQHIVAHFEGVGDFDYWEAWEVLAGQQITTIPPEIGYDDGFDGPSGSYVHSSASFYEGLTLPDSFAPSQDPNYPSGILPVTTTDPHLPMDHATPPVIRSWHN